LWDALGFRETCERLKSDGHRLPPWVDALYASGATSLYVSSKDGIASPTAIPGALASVPFDPRVVDFTILKKSGAVVRTNPGATLLDLGDGVFGLEFHSKMNALGQDTISMIVTACNEAEASAQALVVANYGENFSAGANLMLLLMEAQEGTGRRSTRSCARSRGRRIGSSSAPFPS
jgi:3-hydroxyacyl-CoA dehydrogenase